MPDLDNTPTNYEGQNKLSSFITFSLVSGRETEKDLSEFWLTGSLLKCVTIEIRRKPWNFRPVIGTNICS